MSWSSHWKNSVMALCTCVRPIHINFLQNFHQQAPPPFRACITLLSNLFVAAPLEKVEFLRRDWFPIIRRSGDQFPNWSEWGWFNPRRSSSFVFPIASQCRCWSCGAFSETKAIGCAHPLPLLSSGAAAGSRTIKITNSSRENLGVGRFTIPPVNYQKVQKSGPNIILTDQHMCSEHPRKRDSSSYTSPTTQSHKSPTVTPEEEKTSPQAITLSLLLLLSQNN